MKVFLASAGPSERPSNIPIFERLARRSVRHMLVDDPAGADIILFTECHFLGSDWRLREIRSSEVARCHWDKCYVYDERDRPWCAMPGLFVSMPNRSFDPGWQVATSYTLVEEPWVKANDEGLRTTVPDLLMSFVGSRTHACRDEVFALAGEPHSIIEPVTDGFVFYDPSSTDFERHQRRFAEVIYRSKFVLCPRGTGTSSIRSFETMAAERVPVIISDDWTPPVGPDWDSFAIRWPESRISSLPNHLRTLEGAAEEMGRRAGEVFRQRYAPDVWFEHRMDELEQLHARRGRRTFPRSGVRGRGEAAAGTFALKAQIRARASRGVGVARALMSRL